MPRSPVIQTKPKQADVARLAGVSKATVSQVLNNNSAFSIPQETRQRILDAVTQLGYVPNSLARSLRTQKTYTIASVIPDIANPFYPTFERGIQDVAEANNYDLVVYNTDGVEAKERRYLNALLQGRVDGVIGVFFHLKAEDLALLIERNVAVVLLDEPQDTGSTPVDRVFVDNIKAARAATEYLIGQGHQRIAMLSGQHETLSGRVAGYRQALEADGFEPQILEAGDFTEACGYSGMLELLKAATRPSAVFAANDVMAMGALVALRERGVRVPEDIVLMGFDDIPASRILTPALTTVSQFPEHLGRRAAQLLFDRLSGRTTGPGRLEELPFELIVRQSTAGPTSGPTSGSTSAQDVERRGWR